MDDTRLEAQRASTARAAESHQIRAMPNAPFPQHYPPHSLSLASSLRLGFVHGTIAILLVFASTLLWVATFGELPMSVDTTTPHCFHDNVGPAASAARPGQ